MAGAASAQVPVPGALDEARRAFYDARYASAAALTADRCLDADGSARDTAAQCELYTSAVLFQVRRLLGDAKDRKAAWQQCAACPALVASFKAGMTRGVAAARGRLRQSSSDDEALFLLGKLNLNYVWLELGTLGHRTGWSEYWEGRRSLDAVLARQPGHVRAMVARAWIDYIVDTRVGWGRKWLLGGGDRRRALATVRTAAAADADFFTRTEARFALWDMLVRERDIAAAVDAAAALQRDFPDNPDLSRFLDEHAPPGRTAERPGSAD